MRDIQAENNSTIQEILEAEFCPPLDSALVAALVADREDDVKLGSTRRESNIEEMLLRDLRETLSALARDAADQMDSAIANELASAHISSQSATTDDVDSLFDLANDAISNSGSSSTSASSNLPFASALGFLRASFPHLPLSKLKTVLRDAEISGIDDNDEKHELNMEHIVEVLLNEDYVRELEDRGYEDEELAEEAEKWQTVNAKPGRKNVPVQQKPTPPKKKSKKSKVSIVDVRQRQHTPSSTPSSPLATDPWNRLFSLSSYLSTLFPTRSAAFFSSYFHSPNYSSPADALRAALQTIHKERITLNFPTSGKPTRKSNLRTNSTNTANSNNVIPTSEADTTGSLFYLFDILYSSSDYDELSEDERAQLMSDGQLALGAVGGVSDVTLEVVKLLQDLHEDRTSSKQEMGIYHATPPLSASPTSPNPKSTTLQKSLHIHVPPPTVIHPPRPPPAPNQSTKRHPQRSLSYCGPSSSSTSAQWTTVKPRQANGVGSSPGFSPLAEFIPAYNPLNVPRKVKARAGFKGGLTELSTTAVRAGAASAPNSPLLSNGNNLGTGGGLGLQTTAFQLGIVRDGFAASRSTGSYYKDNLHELRRKRDEALREASRYWQRGSAKSRGGEVAMYFAQRAREISEEARRVKLDAARQLVENKRTSNGDADTIDLHYTTTSEAVMIVKEVLDEGWVSSSRPLQIITGRGSHSMNGVGVLGPTVKNALELEGWNVEKWNAGLLIRGRRAILR